MNNDLSQGYFCSTLGSSTAVLLGYCQTDRERELFVRDSQSMAALVDHAELQMLHSPEQFAINKAF